MQATSLHGRTRYLNQYLAARSERSEWEAEWRDISDYLLPGRGIFQIYSKPRKRRLTSPKVVNAHATDALNVLTSGLQGGLTNPSREWFLYEWYANELNNVDELKAYMEGVNKVINRALHMSNFYSIIHSFYTEYCGFGNGCVYIGEDSDVSPLRFELLTVGEYAFTVGGDGMVDTLYRTIFLTPRQAYERWGDKCSKSIVEAVKREQGQKERAYVTILEAVVPEKFMGMPYKRYFWELSSVTSHGEGNVAPSSSGPSELPLEVNGFHEFPYGIGRFDLIGSDVYGVGPGSRALPDIKRLQEIEKGLLMASHKSLHPPLFAPGRLRGKINSLPGGYTYYNNPSEKVTTLYDHKFDGNTAGMMAERTTQRIDRNFYNDIFLTASRDPNASPMKATEVNVKEAEKMLRLGPVTQRLEKEFFSHVLDRVFNICKRKGLLPALSPELEQLVADSGGYKVNIISPLAQAQKQIALQGIQTTLAAVGQMANYDQKALHKINIDRTVDEFCDINGTPRAILNSDEEVAAIREAEAKAQQQAMGEQRQAQEAQIKSQLDAEQAATMKTQADAGVAMMEGQEMASDIGVF